MKQRLSPRRRYGIQFAATLLAIVSGSPVPCVQRVNGRSDELAHTHQDRIRLPNGGDSTIDVRVQSKSFVEIVDFLLEHTGLPYVLDDLPLKKSGDFAFRGRVDEALERLCDQFDLSCKLSKSGVLLFMKRFHDPEEHPQMIQAELLRTAHDVDSILSVVPYEPKGIAWPLEVRSLYQSLNDQQLNILSKREKLYWQDLSDAQRAQLCQAIYGNSFGDTVAAWRNLSQQMAGMPGSALHVQASNRLESLLYVHPVAQGRHRAELLHNRAATAVDGQRK